MEEFSEQKNEDTVFIPLPCQNQSLSTQSKKNICDESISWLKEENGNLPMWSRLRSTNCMGLLRGAFNSKKKNHDIEIPGILLSLFGSIDHQTECMDNMFELKNYQLLSCVLILGAALKKPYQHWSTKFLDAITTTAATEYPKLIKHYATTDEEFDINHLSQKYHTNGDVCRARLLEVAKGFVYIPYSDDNDEFNLARALGWFFNHYQFGLVQCNNRTLAFGNILDNEFPFFLYDCQSRGYPLFKDKQANSYILRASHLQVLLYCLTITLNITTENTEFVLLNVDLRMTNPNEVKYLNKEKYKPILLKLMEKYKN